MEGFIVLYVCSITILYFSLLYVVDYMYNIQKYLCEKVKEKNHAKQKVTSWEPKEIGVRKRSRARETKNVWHYLTKLIPPQNSPEIVKYCCRL